MDKSQYYVSDLIFAWDDPITGEWVYSPRPAPKLFIHSSAGNLYSQVNQYVLSEFVWVSQPTISSLYLRSDGESYTVKSPSQISDVAYELFKQDHPPLPLRYYERHVLPENTIVALLKHSAAPNMFLDPDEIEQILHH